MPLHKIIILGAGPAGLSTALALAQLSRSQSSSPLQITVLEIRSKPTTLGGTINLTPLGLRYVDRLGAGAKLRPLGMPVRGIDLLSLRTGGSLGTLWKDVDALRVKRSDLVASLLETCQEGENAELIKVRFGVKVVAISEEGTAEEDGKVILQTESGETVVGDVLIGCDGIHSIARKLYVQPERSPEYSGKAVAYGSVRLEEPGKARIYRSDGSQAITDTSLFSGQFGSMMATFADPEKSELHFGGVLGMDNVTEGDREGWKTRGEDKATVRKDILDRFKMWKVRGLLDALEKVDDWILFPVHKLPPHGKWSRGRVMVIGDAAHAMPPQGESTGVSIEDGVLMAHVFQRHATRTVAQLFADYESLRRQEIEKLYKDTAWRWQNAATHDAGWLWSIFMEWMTTAFVWAMKWKGGNYFASDVAKLKLPG